LHHSLICKLIYVLVHLNWQHLWSPSTRDLAIHAYVLIHCAILISQYRYLRLDHA
jgi:hypothetical protein